MNKEQLKTYYNACRFIFQNYGEDAQKRQLIQELAELIVALTKNDSENIIEEMADVQVMFDQFTLNKKCLYEKIELMQLKKVERQVNRIVEANKIEERTKGD